MLNEVTESMHAQSRKTHSIDNPRNRVDKLFTLHTIVDELVQLVDVVPASVVAATKEQKGELKTQCHKRIKQEEGTH